MSLEATRLAPEGESLAKNSVGITQIVFFVVAAAAPLTAVVGASPAAFAFGNGAGVPGAFVLAGLLACGLGARLFCRTAIFAEEARTPEKTIPQATYIAVLLITVFYAFSTWAIAQFYGPSNIPSTAQAGLETLFFVAAEQVLGAWSVQALCDKLGSVFE